MKEIFTYLLLGTYRGRCLYSNTNAEARAKVRVLMLCWWTTMVTESVQRQCLWDYPD